MAQWVCEKCGYSKEGRCKPKKCPSCGESGTFVKDAAAEEKKK
jgi:rubrerythrin